MLDPLTVNGVAFFLLGCAAGSLVTFLWLASTAPAEDEDYGE